MPNKSISADKTTSDIDELFGKLYPPGKTHEPSFQSLWDTLALIAQWEDIPAPDLYRLIVETSRSLNAHQAMAIFIRNYSYGLAEDNLENGAAGED